VTGIILAGSGVASAVAAIIVGVISDRIGYKTVLVVASVAAAAFSIPQYVVTATWQLFALRVLIGLATGAIMPAAGALTAMLVPASKRGTAYGLTGSATSLGFGVGPLTAALVVSLWGIRPVFLTAALLMAGIAVWVAAMIQMPAKEDTVGQESEQSEEHDLQGRAAAR
jgi:MFS family permease